MFGIGNGQDRDQEPQSTASMWGSLGGMGSLFKMVSDPALQAHAHAMMQAIIEGAHASLRIEAKLDLLLRDGGHNVANINARLPRPPAILEAQRANGVGGHPAASQPSDDGVSGTAQGVATHGGALGSGGADYLPPDDGVA